MLRIKNNAEKWNKGAWSLIVTPLGEAFPRKWMTKAYYISLWVLKKGEIWNY